MIDWPNRFVVTGTDTDVGKSVVAAMLTLVLGADYWKPVQAGHPTDTEWVQQVTELPDGRFCPEAHCSLRAASPHLFGDVDSVQVALPQRERLVVEGAGGLLVPINRRETMIDLFVALALPVVVVARSTLGTINHTLMTLEIVRARRLEVIGVILNGRWDRENADAIGHYGSVLVIGGVEPMNPINPSNLERAYAHLETAHTGQACPTSP
jgi:dethiobiotin synthetase